jgi:O-antigen ligase
MLTVLKHAIFVDALISLGLITLTLTMKQGIVKTLSHKVATMALLIPVIGYLSPSLVVLNIAAVLLIPFIAKSRSDVGGLLIVGLLMIPAIGQALVVGPLYLLPFNVQASISIGALIAILMHPSRGPGLPLKYDISFFLVLVLMIFIGARDTSFTNALRATSDYMITYGLPYFVFTRSVRNAEDIRSVVHYLIMTTVLLAFVLIYEAHTSWPMYQAMVDHYGRNLMSGFMVHVRGGYLRAGGPFLEATTMAFVMSMGTCAVWAMRSSFKSDLSHKVVMAIVCLALLAAQSRGGMLGVVVGVVSVEIYRKQLRKALTLGVAVAFLFIGLVAVSVGKSGVGAYFSGDAERGQHEQEYRVRLFHRGIEEVAKSPILGESSAVVSVNMQDLRQGEGLIDFVNTYLYMAIFAGIVGLTLLTTAMIYPQALLWGHRNSALSLPIYREVAPFLAGSTLSASTQFFFTAFTGGHLRLVLLMFGLGGVVCSQIIRERRKQRMNAAPAVSDQIPYSVQA